MNEAKIARINELYHKSKNEGLSPEEVKEQKELRSEYIASVRNNLTGQLDSITVVNPDGTSRNLGMEHKKRTLH